MTSTALMKYIMTRPGGVSSILEFVLAISVPWPVCMWDRIRRHGSFIGRQCLAVLILTLLNLIDAATYGRLIIPIPKYSSLGITIFLMSTFTAQLTFSLASSFHSGVTGAAIIENIPFIHAMCYALQSRGLDQEAVISTLMYACILTTMLYSFLFLVLAWSGTDRLVHQFPRSVLVGSMGGIGLFLIRTAVTLPNSHPSHSLYSAISIIVIPSMLALVALFGEKRLRYPFVAPIGSLLLFVLFHAVLMVFDISLDSARDNGWLLPENNALDASDAFGSIFSLLSRLDPKRVNFNGLYSLLGTIVSMALFGLLHVPINIPSYARSTGSSFNMHQELLAHCYSNFASCFFGFIPGYFVYANSVLFYKAGAQGRITGIALSILTLCLLFWINVVSFIPIIVVRQCFTF